MVYFHSTGLVRCYLWDSKAQLWSWLLSSTYNLVALNIERWISLIFPGKYLQIDIIGCKTKRRDPSYMKNTD